MKKLFSKLLSAAAAVTISGMTITAPTIEAGFNLDTNSIVVEKSDKYANYSETSYNYGFFLDENNAEVYMAFMKLINPTTETFTVKLPNPVTISVSSNVYAKMTESDKQIYTDALFSSCRSGIDSALFDIPELFWLDINNMSVGIENMSSSYNIFTRKFTLTLKELSFTPQYYQEYGSLDNVFEYKQKLVDAVENFPVKGDTRYEKLKSIHDRICSFTYYDDTAPFMTSAVGSIVEPGVVCEGYSEGFKMICDNLGIPCVVVVGNFDETTSIGHMWNYVQMEDGKWYAVDTTWDDHDGKLGVELDYKYFLKGANSFNKNHFQLEQLKYMTINYPELSASDYVPGASTVTTTTVTTVAKTTTTTASSTTTTTSKTAVSSTTTTSSITTKSPTNTTSSTSTTTSANTTSTTKVSTTTTTSLSTTTSTNKKTTTTTSTVTTTSTNAKTTTTATAEDVTTTSKASTTEAAKTTTYQLTTTVVATTTSTPTVPERLKGDVNNDGAVNIADVVYCAGAVLGRFEPEYSCDADGDGVLDSFDIAFIQRIIIFNKQS